MRSQQWYDYWTFVFNREPHYLISWDFYKRKNQGFILTFIKRIVWLIDIVSPVLFLLRLTFGRMEKFRSQYRRKAFIEQYCISWLVIEVIILRFASPSSCVFVLILTIYLSLRVIDIIQSQLRLGFFRIVSADNIPARSFLLVVVNYIEMILIFASLYHLRYESFFPVYTESLGYSVQVFVPLLNPYIDPSHIIWKTGVDISGVFYTEIIASVFIHLFVIQNVLSLFKNQTSSQ